MKYTKISFSYNNFKCHETGTLNGYTKNHLYTTLGYHHMYVNTDKLEIGKERFKKELLKYYNNIINKIENLGQQLGHIVQLNN